MQKNINEVIILKKLKCSYKLNLTSFLKALSLFCRSRLLMFLSQIFLYVEIARTDDMDVMTDCRQYVVLPCLL